MSFLYKAELSNKEEVFCKEINVSQYKTLLKCFIGEELNVNIILKNLNNILLQNTELTTLKNINLYDYFLLVLYLRYISIGNLITAQLEQKDKKIKLEINVLKIITTLLRVDIKKLLEPIIYKQIKVYFRIPNIFEMQMMYNSDILYLSYFIEKISVNDKIVYMQNFNYVDTEKILDNLPVKLTTTISKKVREIVTELNSIDIFAFLKGLEKQVFFSFNPTNYCSLLRLLFGGDLNSLYDNIFILSKYCNFSAQYIEACTPGEYFLFVKKLEEQLSKNKKQSADQFTPEGSFNDGLGG